MVQIIEKELRLVRELAKGKGATIHGPLDVTRGETSHQMGGVVKGRRRVVAFGGEVTKFTRDMRRQRRARR